jgi:hypothetical protein
VTTSGRTSGNGRDSFSAYVTPLDFPTTLRHMPSVPLHLVASNDKACRLILFFGHTTVSCRHTSCEQAIARRRLHVPLIAARAILSTVLLPTKAHAICTSQYHKNRHHSQPLRGRGITFSSSESSNLQIVYPSFLSHFRLYLLFTALNMVYGLEAPAHFENSNSNDASREKGLQGKCPTQQQFWVTK